MVCYRCKGMATRHRSADIGPPLATIEVRKVTSLGPAEASHIHLSSYSKAQRKLRAKLIT